MRRAGLSIASALLLSCGQKAPPPLPQATIVVDTDLPVSRLAARLRVDVYDDRGTWIESREAPLPERASWPASFTVYSPNDASRTVLVRLRLFPEGQIRDYQGERFEDRPAALPANEVVPFPSPTPAAEPRLRIEGRDVTPRSEPIPSVTIDRLVRLALTPDTASTARLSLRVACAGTMADLANGATCVDVEGARVPVTDAPLQQTTPPEEVAPCTATPRGPSLAKSGTPLLDEELCVPGGWFVLGDRLLGFSGNANGIEISATPPRLVFVPALRMDRYEVTVGRFRDALDRGFDVDVDSLPLSNPNPLPSAPTTDPLDLCTYSDAPLEGDARREDFAVNCLDWEIARAFCRFAGGDLPTEAQWEWVASVAGRARKTPYPWGLDEPSCDREVFGREPDVTLGGNECLGAPWFAPYSSGPVTAGIGDETPPLRADGAGVHGLGGGLSELTRDVFQPYRSRCWLGISSRDPWCAFGDRGRRTGRGGGWSLQPFMTLTVARLPASTLELANDVTFRCMRPGIEP
jgi:formylglycine-generating enzyme required for sulfatase activity